MENLKGAFLWNKGYDAGYTAAIASLDVSAKQVAVESVAVLSIQDLKFLYEIGIQFEEDIVQ